LVQVLVKKAAVLVLRACTVISTQLLLVRLAHRAGTKAPSKKYLAKCAALGFTAVSPVQLHALLAPLASTRILRVLNLATSASLDITILSLHQANLQNAHLALPVRTLLLAHLRALNALWDTTKLLIRALLALNALLASIRILLKTTQAAASALLGSSHSLARPAALPAQVELTNLPSPRLRVFLALWASIKVAWR